MTSIVNIIRRHFLALAVGIIGLCAFSYLVIRSFSDWNFFEESVAFDFINYFWGENFRFFRIPHFDWHSDYLLYPYGCDVTFIFWGFEMNIFGALFKWMFGSGPWGQCYYLYSLCITYLGVYLLLVNRRGRVCATLFAFTLTFCNYAAICKFPMHFTLCIVHWPILSVLFDVVTIEKFWNGERFSVRFVLIRALVLLLCLGLELGYIAGFACFSFAFTCVYMFCMEVARKRSIGAVKKELMAEVCRTLRSLGESPWNIVLVCLIVIVSWVYLPIIFQILTNAPTQSQQPTTWGTNPLRIFLPIFPGWNAATTLSQPTSMMGRAVHGTIYAWSAGWSALLVFWIGIVIGGKKNVKKWFPFVFVLFLFIAMRWIPIVSWIPMFKYARIPERFSPYLLVTLMIPLYYSFGEIRSWLVSIRKAWWAILMPVLIVWVLETSTAYTGTFLWADSYPLSKFSDDYIAAERKVRELPGEALFFMPFSAHGGDGRGLTDYHYLTAHQMQFAARCGKKMNGIYLGRMAEDVYLKDFSCMNWRSYFGHNPWSKAQWDNLEEFFRNSDFCAVVIETKILTPEQRDDIVAHLGASIAKFAIFDNVYEVIPMPKNLRGSKDVSKISSHIFNYGEISSTPFFFKDFKSSVQFVSGFATVEPWGIWSDEKTVQMRFAVPKRETPVRVIINAQAFLGMKTADVYCEERKLAEWKMTVAPMTPSDYAVEIPPELTGAAVTLRIEQHDAVRPCDIGFSDDSRTLGLGFISIRMDEQKDAIPCSNSSHGSVDVDDLLVLSSAPEEFGTLHGHSENGPRVVLLEGFAQKESWGTWSQAKVCKIGFVVPRRETPVRVVFNAQAFYGMKTADVYCGERKLTEWKMAVAPMSPADYIVEIPPELTGKAITLRFEQHDVARPCDIGFGADSRTLGLGLISVRLEE